MTVLPAALDTSVPAKSCVPPRRARAILSALLVHAWLISPAAAQQLTAEQRSLATKVSALYRANAGATGSVECDYTFHMNAIRRVCRYARDGGKFYHGSVDLYPNGARGLAREGAWDGQRATHRQNPHYLTRSIDPDDAKPSCATPDKAIDNYILPLLDAVMGRSDTYECVGAEVVQVDGQECIELRFKARAGDDSAITRHPRAFRYMPTYCAYYDHAGKLQNEMAVEYASADSDGNVVYYALRVVQHTYGDEGQRDVFRWEIERDSLKLNGRPEPKRFVVEPWPSDVVMDLNTFKDQAPSDPDWSPVGNTGFPYDVYYEGVKPEDARSRLVPARALAARSQAPSASADGSGDAAAPVVAGAAGAMPAPPPESNLWWWTLAAGVVLTLAGVAWSWHLRRRTS